MRILIVASIVAAVTSPAAAVPIYSIFVDQDSGAGTFQVRIRTDPRYGGLASYKFPLYPTAGTTMLTLDHRSARVGSAENRDGTLSGPVGFTVGRSPDGVANLVVQGSQDYLTPTPFIIYDYGVRAGSFATVQNGPIPLGSIEGNNWADWPVIVSGTYSPGGWVQVPRTDPQKAIYVFANRTGTDVVQAFIFPEPSSGGIAAVGLAGMMGLRRQRRRA